MAKSSIAVGLKKGYPTEKLNAYKANPNRRRGALSKRVKLIREVVREVSGLSPYEKRLLDILKAGGANSEKRSYKFAKKRLGGHKRAIAKREEIKAIYAQIRARG